MTTAFPLCQYWHQCFTVCWTAGITTKKKNGVQQYVIFSFFSYFTNSKAQHRCTMCLCEEASGPLKWEEVEDVQYVAGYLVRGHLAWLGDPVTPPQPGELPWVRCSNITLPWELREWAGNKTSEVEKKKKISSFSTASVLLFVHLFSKSSISCFQITPNQLISLPTERQCTVFLGNWQQQISKIANRLRKR